MTQEETKELYEAISMAKKECTNQYALSYLDAIDEAGILHGPNGFRTQLMYVLNNMQYWRGSTARQVKAVFKKAISKLK